MVELHETIGRKQKSNEVSARGIGGTALEKIFTDAAAAPGIDKDLRESETAALEEAVSLKVGFENRRGVVINGPLGWPMRINQRLTIQQVQALQAEGVGVPLDLVPGEYWWNEEANLPRFGEEMLGDDF